MKGLVTAALLVVAAGACSSGGSSGAGTPTGDQASTVHVKLLAFTPGDLHVKAGTTVTWRSDEPITHTVTSGAVEGVDPTSGLRSGQRSDGRFDGRLAAKGSTFSYRFAEPGTYSYYCSIHHGMNASVVVTA